jgi:hypothetical protein
MPIVDTGWDARPWHGPSSRVCYGRSVKRWKKLLREAKAYLDRTGGKRLVLGPLNEWGEGSYIEPCTEYGFGMYDAVRDVFCRGTDYPPILVPSDVGLGPYGVASNADRSSWTFEGGSTGRWCVKSSTASCVVRDGHLILPSSNLSQKLQSPPLGIRARDYRGLEVRLKIRNRDAARGRVYLWWKLATGHRFRSSVSLPGGQGFSTCTFDLSDHPLWRGTISHVGMRTATGAGGTTVIDDIRLLPE